VKTLPVRALILFLAGGAAFGVYKSLDLLDKNADLGYSLALVNVRIEEMRLAVDEVQVQLEESGVVNEQLSNELVHLKRSLAEKEDKIGQYHRYALLLKKKMGDVDKVNEVLAKDSREVRELLMRVRLENRELRQKMSSVKELKLAIQELKRRPQPVRRRAAPRTQRPPASGRGPLPDPAIVMGNEGFLVRDGASTFSALVDIQVRPAFEAATSM